jgi:alpha-L-rhamnosidase
MVDPLGIDIDKPHFSWKLSAPENKQDKWQLMYDISIASSAENLERRKPDICTISASKSIQSQTAQYEGPKLESGKDYYWQVLIWDNEYNRIFSKIARFSTGMFHRSDWDGEWIKHPSATPEKHIWYRKKFNLDSQAQSALVHVATNGYCELYINGQKADNRVLSPAVSRIDQRILYVTYDIAPLLRKGDNVIALWSAAGWTRNDYFAPLVNHALMVQMCVTTKQGTSFRLASDSTWKCAESYSQNTGLFQFMDMGGEEVDGRRFSDEWNTIKFDDHQWNNAAVTQPLKNGDEPVLSAQMTDPSRVIRTIKAKHIADTITGTYSVDMGLSFTGFLDAEFDGLHNGDTVIITVSNLKNLVEEHRQRQRYIARGEDGERFSNRFNYFSGRYIHFTGLRQAPQLRDIQAYAVSSAAPRTGYFECSDTLFNRMYEVDRWTYEMCHTEGVTVDCPNRERLGYGPEGAYQTTWGLGLPCFASAAHYIKNVRDWSDVQNPDGSMNYVAPQISRMFGGALNGTANMNIAWEHYLAHGDPKILHEAYSTGTKWIEFLNSFVVDDLLTPFERGGYFLGEWVRPGPVFEHGHTSEALFFNNCVYAMTLNVFINIAEALGHGDDMTPYKIQRERHRTRMHEKYYDTLTKYYHNGDQVRTAFALYAGIVPDSLRQAMLDHLENDLRNEHPYFNIGSFTRYPYCNILYFHPQFQEIISDILAKTTYPGYGYFLANGETSWPETWEIIHPNSSIIHTSYAGVPSGWFIKVLAGINPSPEGPGYRHFTIRPQTVKRLYYAKAAVESPYGLIESGWRKDKDKNVVIYDISIPVGTDAQLYLPAPASRITENGQPIPYIESDDGYTKITVKQGKYRFDVKNGER